MAEVYFKKDAAISISDAAIRYAKRHSDDDEESLD